MQRFSGTIETLQLRWDLLKPLHVETRLSNKVFLELVKAYSSQGRYYHTLEHIQQVLDRIAESQSNGINVLAIQLAAWFHDVIYNSLYKDNEERSAEYATEKLSEFNISNSTIIQVKKMILNTKNHQALPHDIDSQILIDADLAILGSSESEYRAYAQLIRQEYSWVADAEYREGRKRVLQNFLQREKIFLTKDMFSKLEVTARQNIQAEIAALSFP